MTNSSTLHLVYLQPQKYYFLGGEKTFGKGNEENYYALSNIFPSQTSLLGMIRYQLLKQNGLLQNNVIIDKQKASLLIGKESFNAENSEPYGIINKISPLMVDDGSSLFYLGNKEYVNNGIKNSKLKLTAGPKNCKISFNNKGPENLSLIPENYNPKEGFISCLVCLTNPGVTYDFEEVFNPFSKVGIRKNQKDESDEKGFYKQDFWGINPKFRFAFFVECTNSMEYQLESASVHLGGEKSIFKMETRLLENQFMENIFPKYNQREIQNNGEVHKIVLLSDAFTDDSIYDECELAITESNDFRHIKTKVETKNNYADKPDKSNKYNLLKRGSAFYTYNPKVVFNKLDAATAFRNIGYNHYILNKIHYEL